MELELLSDVTTAALTQLNTMVDGDGRRRAKIARKLRQRIKFGNEGAVGIEIGLARGKGEFASRGVLTVLAKTQWSRPIASNERNQTEYCGTMALSNPRTSS